MSGKFITIEGGEGGGKSTNMAFVESYLVARDIDLVVSREPGGTELSEKIRTLLLDPENRGMASDTELLLMFAARAQHLEELIQPALSAGKWVLCDRFTDATYAYQGGGRGLPMQRISQLETWVQGELRPDLTLLLDLPVSMGMERAGKRGDLDRFEQEELTFFERVRECYLERARQKPGQYRIIDASKSLEAVQGQISMVLDKALEEALEE